MSLRPFNILMADDDPEDLELIEDAVLHIRPEARLHKVHSGKKAIEFLSRQKDDELPCLMILDYNMPELNGAEVLSELNAHSRYKNIPKLILSTSNAPLHVHECMSKGAAEYFVKPTNMKELNALVEKMLGYCNGHSSGI
jgi:CheY-like chemotaxis protein